MQSFLSCYSHLKFIDFVFPLAGCVAIAPSPFVMARLTAAANQAELT